MNGWVCSSAEAIRPLSTLSADHGTASTGTPLVDPEQARDVARWRKAERERLINARSSLDAQYRADQTLIIARKLDEILAASGVAAPAVSVYWPIRGEPGVGYPGAELRTIFPQPHDIPMDWVVTG